MSIGLVAAALLAAAPAASATPPAGTSPITLHVKEETPGLLVKAKVSGETALHTAKRKVPGESLVAAEIEEEDGHLQYSFEFRRKGRSGVDEVNVDALDGTVLGVEHENPASEAGGKAKDASPR